MRDVGRWPAPRLSRLKMRRSTPRWKEENMSNTTIIVAIIVVLVILFGGYSFL